MVLIHFYLHQTGVFRSLHELVLVLILKIVSVRRVFGTLRIVTANFYLWVCWLTSVFLTTSILRNRLMDICVNAPWALLRTFLVQDIFLVCLREWKASSLSLEDGWNLLLHLVGILVVHVVVLLF